ncbi:MAG: hypothetical protein LBP29_05980 [Treponema sp.]|nr:hypothetical protein [Treponema sp.]
MKKIFVVLVLILGIVSAGGLAAQSGGKTIHFVSVSADGDSSQMTEFITIEVSGAGAGELKQNDITITSEESINTWRSFRDNEYVIFEFYFDTDVSRSHEVTVTIEKQGYTVTPSSRTVLVFDGKGPAQ